MGTLTMVGRIVGELRVRSLVLETEEGEGLG